MRVTRRLARLDAVVLRRMPGANTDRATLLLRLIVFYQAVALLEVFIGLATDDGLVTGLASGPLMLGISAAWRLLYYPGAPPPSSPPS